jgi:transposase
MTWTAGDKVKIDRRDCRRLAWLHRAGELVAIRIPPLARRQSGIGAAPGPTWAGERSRARRRLQAFLLRHGRVYRAGPAGPASTSAGWAPSASTTPSCRPPSATTGRWRPPGAQVAAIQADLAEAATQPPFADAVCRLAAYRDVGQLGALSLAAEVGEGQRFAHAGAFMAFTGLVPCERSSGDSVWRAGRCRRLI